MGRHALPAEPAPQASVVVDRPAEVVPQYRTRAEARAAERAALAAAPAPESSAVVEPVVAPVAAPVVSEPVVEPVAAPVAAPPVSEPVRELVVEPVAAPTERSATSAFGAIERAAEAGRVVPRPGVRRVGRASRPVTATRPAAVTRAADVRPAPHVRRTMKAQRLALLVAPVIAMTSAITFAMPANATTVTSVSSSVAAPSQHYSVSTSITVPEIDNGVTTIVSYPSVVVSGGASVADAQATIGAALSAGGQRAQVLQTALSYLGTPYVEGGATHESIDCSGLTMVAYAAVGIPLVHYVPTQDAAATTVPEAAALPGDLVVYDNGDHVGIFLGNGLVLQAPHPGATVDIVPMYSAAHHFAQLLPAS